MKKANLYSNENIVNKKIAFTLAEVLITLSIVGVIAAMTIPTLMSNIEHKKRESF